VGNVDLPLAHHSYLLYELNCVAQFADELELEVGVWDVVEGLAGANLLLEAFVDA